MSGRFVGLGIIVLGIIFVVSGGILVFISGLNVSYIDYEYSEVSGPKDWIDESFTVPAGEYVYRDRILPDVSMVTVEFNITLGGAIDIWVLDEQDYLRFQDGEKVSNSFPGGEGVGKAIIHFRLPHGGRWFFVWNNISPSGIKGISAIVSWTGTVIDSVEVTKYEPMFDQDFSSVGSYILVIGIVVILFGIVYLFRNKATLKSDFG